MRKTIIEIFQKSVKKHSSNVFLWEHNGIEYIGTTYKKVEEDTKALSAALMELGVVKTDKVALLSEGRNAWVVSELAILHIGAINVPLSVKLELDELAFRIEHSDSKVVIVSGAYVEQVKEAIQENSKVNHVICLDKNSSNDILNYDDLLSRGKEILMHSQPIQLPDIHEDDIANICYTSGTTADPKGIVLTHKNYVTNVVQSESLFKVPDFYKSLMILPWDHSFAHTVGIYTLMKNGASLASIQKGKTQAETIKNIGKNIKEIEPSFLLSVPALARNFKTNIEKAVASKSPVIKKIFKTALQMAYSYNKEGCNKGSGFQFFKKPILKIFDSIIFKKIRQNFGGQLKFFVGGGALLDIDLQRFFYAIGMPMFQGYGLSESAPVISSNTLERHKLGSSGIIAKGIDVKICDENGKILPPGNKGEIVVRGDNVMKGYWNNEKATNEVLKDGWLYTGDLGYLDDDGYLYVLGRFKSLLIGNDGEKYSPESIEAALIEHSHFISQCMLFNNQNNYTIALIFPNYEKLKSEISLRKDVEDIEIKAIELINAEIGKFKEGGKYKGLFPERWLPATFFLLNIGFTQENKMQNSTMKMVRNRIIATYKAQIEYLYTPEGKNIFNKENVRAISENILMK